MNNTHYIKGRKLTNKESMAILIKEIDNALEYNKINFNNIINPLRNIGNQDEKEKISLN